jgi:hypothetical protein
MASGGADEQISFLLLPSFFNRLWFWVENINASPSPSLNH